MGCARTICKQHGACCDAEVVGAACAFPTSPDRLNPAYRCRKSHADLRGGAFHYRQVKDSVDAQVRWSLPWCAPSEAHPEIDIGAA